MVNTDGLKRPRPSWQCWKAWRHTHRTGVQVLVDIIASDDQEGRGGGTAVGDAGAEQSVPLKAENVDLIPDACRVIMKHLEHIAGSTPTVTLTYDSD